MQWALAGYTLAYALVLITGGRLGDTFGRKRLFLIGVTGFTIMSALCGAAQSPGMLIASRVAQGAMGAIMVPQVLAVIQVIFPPAERIKALGMVIAPLADIVLDRVPRQDAGSASGVFNTGLQVGNSIGIAVIGVIFFGLLGAQSGPAASAVAPQLRAGLAAASVPAQYTARIETQFGACLHDRLVAADPTVTPPSCRPSGAERTLPASVDRVLAGAGATAVRRDFAASVQRTLWFQVGVFLLSFLFMLALPRGSGRRTAAGSSPPPQSAAAPAGSRPLSSTSVIRMEGSQ